MSTFLRAVAFLLITGLAYACSSAPASTTDQPARITAVTSPALPDNPLYNELGLEQAGLAQAVFEYALTGRRNLGNHHPVLTIADMSQPSTQKRLYVIDLKAHKLLFNTYVAHGRNSGGLVPDRFSNTPSSWQTSLGFYRTLGTYMGKHGLSLQLKGLEKGFNTNVQDRNIVLHGANYVCEDTVRLKGRLGWSEGCPAVPYALSKPIILAVKDGSCLFVYAPNDDYLKKSVYLNAAKDTL
ncbi:murein L,D-transpeptidase catalytic domain family protein [Spirosoma rhododendri]|uniref:Murein L,D-transpeptidase catalytic domain family protein n=1 Tax=Spirosoma rhododendri TaxID=2728024 RepID=A0A7L5DQN0_9BACT|nr:murein L,D-transpeptidase catalytic domain family protein [Spirosoma rhododendri]QJD80774.1 murein L,D-transpeptidase catalytic domain family protein [Spirosoma rhododendri]